MWKYAEYSSFMVYNEATNYQMHVSRYSGNAGEHGFSHVDGMMFSTYDRDNDRWSGNCAEYNGGGFWYKDCSLAGVNGVRDRGNDFGWQGYTSVGATRLQTSRMWLTC